MNASLRRRFFFAAALLLAASPALRAADGSVSFNGADQYVFVPGFHNAGVSGEVTVEFWAKTNTAAIQQAAFMLFPDQPANRFQASISYFNGNTYWDCGDINAGGRVSMPNPDAVNKWTHYAFVSSASGGFMKIYINGVEAASKTGPVSAFNTGGNGTAGYGLYIGGGSGFSLNGSLDEFRVWNTVRTQWEIQRDLGATLSGSEAGLRLYYKFDEGSGSNLATNSAITGSIFNGGLYNGTTRSAPARLTVSNTDDSSVGSLRQAVADAALAAGPSYITFDPALSGQTITLDSKITVIDITGPVTIDASSLPGGLTLDGSGGAAAHEIFNVESSANLSLHGLTLTGAKDSAITSSGKLTLTRCTLFGNSSTENGGAIYNFKDSGANALLSHCTLFGNSAVKGGAIYCEPPNTVIPNSLTLEHCTLSGNSASTAGGGIVSTGTFLNLDNCIVAGNSAPSGPNFSGEFNGSNNLTNGDPLLSPLGYYGGSTMTMRPLPGSPAIDTGKVIAGLSTDQRGFPRSRDGNGTGGAQADIGAVELNPITVTTTVDELTTPSSLGAGVSLREAVRSQADVFFDPTLNGQTIGLTLDTEIVLNQSVSIDASSLPAGLTVDGISSSGANRLFTVSAGQSVTMTGLTLTGGKGAGASAPGSGGAILNQGTLTLNRCTLTGNFSGAGGGAISNSGVLIMNATTLTDNSTFDLHSAPKGGALANIGTATLTQCTFHGNTAVGSGGAISQTTAFFLTAASLKLNHCTVSGNTTVAYGGGLHNDGTESTLTITNSILAGNTGTGGADIHNNSSVRFTGANLVTSYVQGAGGSATYEMGLLTTNPLLGLLGDYGGPTRTMLPKPGSPAINAAVGSTITTDQRGFLVTGTPDIGAVARQGTETLTVTTTADELNSPNNAQTSLREAITDGVADTIIFAPALSGGTITLTRSPAEIAITQGVTVDATGLPKGLTLHGGTGVNRIFNVTSTAPVVLKGLTFTSGDVGSGAGGAILTAAGTDLMIEQCTLTGNTALEGGAVFSLGTLVVRLSTFSGNTGNYGGALQCQGETTINRCTISGNQGPTVCGGIFNKFTTTAKPLLIGDSIIAGNTSPWPDGDDIYTQSGVIWMLNANIVVSRHQDANSSVRNGSTTPLTSNPLLAPLQNYGGPTQTMALKPGSPALNAAPQSNTTTDQRGFPKIGAADIGAYEAGAGEAGAKVNFNVWAWEIIGQALLPDGDNDNDGIKNQMEYAAKYDPFAANGQPVNTPSPNTGGGGGSGVMNLASSFSQEGGESEAAAAPPPTVLSYDLSFRYNPEATDLRYIFQRSSDLSPTGWTDIYTYDSTTGLVTETAGVIGDEDPGSNLIYITDSAYNPARTFWRLVVQQP